MSVIEVTRIIAQNPAAYTVEMDGEAVILDEEADRLHVLNATATLVWQYVMPWLIQAAGSARRLTNGNTVVGIPVLHLLQEVDPSGKVVLELDLAWYQLYRAVPWPEGLSLYD